MTRLKKVSESCQELVSRGFIGRDEADRFTLVAALLPTLDGCGRGVPEEVLMGSVGLDRERLASQIQSVRIQGIEVEDAGDAGYRLPDTVDDSLLPEAVVPRLLERADPPEATDPVRTSAEALIVTPAGDETKIPLVGLPYLYRASCASTNGWLKSEAKGLPSGAVAVTDDQTEGRGRLGRTWSSEAGKDLTFSVFLRPAALTHETTLLSLTAGLAVAEVLERLPGLQGRVHIKWPNDVLIDDRKVCGILAESRSQGMDLDSVVVGIGVNVNSDPMSRLEVLEPSQREAWRGRPTPTSLRAESGASVGRGRLLADLLTRLSDRWFGAGIAESLGGLRGRDGLMGRAIEVYAGPPDGTLLVAGEAAGIDARGELLVRSGDGEITSVSVGEVTLRVDSPTT